MELYKLNWDYSLIKYRKNDILFLFLFLTCYGIHLKKKLRRDSKLFWKSADRKQICIAGKQD
jgi:hypothetical protein